MKQVVKWSSFLKDVFVCSLGAYGGPEAHYGVFTDQLIIKKQYITEEELLELIALTQALPGPSSTQAIIAIGYKLGGPLLGLLTFLVWAIPAILIMTALSFVYYLFSNTNTSSDVLRFIGPMAVGFIVVASIRIGKKILRKLISIILFMIALVVTIFIREVWVFPILLLFGGMVNVLHTKEKQVWNTPAWNIKWRYFILFVFIAFTSVVLYQVIGSKLLFLFDHFYRYGYLVIGGGQVVIPYMYADLVEINQFMTTSEFLTGFGIVQGIPGPMFSFSAYAGALAMRDSGGLLQALGGIVAGIAIFLPGILLIYFVYPIWESLKQVKAVKHAIPGIVAIAGGLIASAAIVLMRSIGLTIPNVIAVIVASILLFTRKIPAPIIVIFVIISGILFTYL